MQSRTSMQEISIRPEYLKQLVIGDKIFKSANNWELTEKEVEKARVELGETEEKKKRGLRELKEKLSKDKGVNYRKDDFYLLRFLRFRKYDVEKTYQNIKRFYDTKRKKPDFMTIPADVRAVQDLKFFTCLPYTDEEGRIILWNYLGRWNPQETSFEEVAQSTWAVFDIVTMNPKSQINGIITVSDADGVNMLQFAEMLRKNRLPAFATLSQNAYPYRVHKAIIVNCNRVMRTFFAIVRPFLTRKVAERTVLLGSDMEELHRYVNPVLLPKKLGGELEEEECSVTQLIVDNLPYIEYERSFT